MQVAGGARQIPKAEVTSRTDSPSGMPATQLVLSAREIRDVVGYLASLQTQ